MAAGADHLDAQPGEPLGRIVGRDLGDGALNVVADSRWVDNRVDRLDAEWPRIAYELRPPRGGNQRLGGDAAVVEAVASHPVPLHQCDRDAELRSRTGWEAT